MAVAGQRWTDFYVAAPVCSPSRGALLTGKYPVRSGLYGTRVPVLFPGDEHHIPRSERLLPELLKARGYRTAIIGKWHLGDAPDALPTRYGFDRWYGLPYSNDMMWTVGPNFDAIMSAYAGGDIDTVRKQLADRPAYYMNPRVEYWNVPLMSSSRGADGTYSDRVVEQPAEQTLLTKRHTEQALEFIRASADAPFLLYVPYSMPHTPIFASSDFAGRSLGGRYGDVIEEIDWSAGRILALLDELALSSNTLVVFTSDNGPWLTMNQHGGSAGLLHHGKGTTFEGGMRVPAIFRWPGTIAPATVSGIGTTMDLFATVVQLAGADLPEDIDGMDLSASLTDGTPSPRKTMAYYRIGELRAFRDGPYKMHVVTEGAYGQPPERTMHDTPLLYHLGEDPAERFDLAATRPAQLERIKASMARHVAQTPRRPPLFDRRFSEAPAR